MSPAFTGALQLLLNDKKMLFRTRHFDLESWISVFLICSIANSAFWHCNVVMSDAALRCIQTQVKVHSFQLHCSSGTYVWPEEPEGILIFTHFIWRSLDHSTVSNTALTTQRRSCVKHKVFLHVYQIKRISDRRCVFYSTVKVSSNQH